MNTVNTVRCGWVPLGDPLYVDYHDSEWGVPVHDDRTLFEFLVLEGAQAGLSWATVLKKRQNYRAAFDGLVPEIVAGYDEARISALMADAGIIRNRLKIVSAVENARAFLELQREFGSASEYLWRFIGGSPRNNAWETLSEVPAATPESDEMSRSLRKRGFRFVGPTVCYAFMQAVGMVNDHTTDCFRYHEVQS